MHVATGEQLDLRMTSHDVGLLLSVLETDPVHPVDAGGEGRVMLEDQGRPIRLTGQLLVEPGQLLRLEPTAGLAGNRRVETNLADRVLIDDVVDPVGG